jgi:hypothetical protein
MAFVSPFSTPSLNAAEWMHLPAADRRRILSRRADALYRQEPDISV